MKKHSIIFLYAIMAFSILCQDSSPDINPDDVTIKSISYSLSYDDNYYL